MPAATQSRKSKPRTKPVPFVKFGIAFGLLTTAIICYWINQSFQTEPQHRIQLSDGNCQVVEVISPTRFRIQMRLEDNDSIEGSDNTFILNLAGVSAVSKGENVAALNFVQQFVNHGKTSVRFDRNRYDHSNQIFGYLFRGDEILNVEIVFHGFAQADLIRGNSVSIQNKIRSAQSDHDQKNSLKR